MNRREDPTCRWNRAGTLAALSLAAALLCSGCLGDREGTIIETSPKVDPLLSHEDHQASAGEPFSLDVSPYLSDDQDAPSQLVCDVVTGGGSFVNQVYQNTFTEAGVHFVIVSVTDSTLNVTESYFHVTVAYYADNAAPVVNTSIPQQVAFVDLDFYCNVADFVTDDYDDPALDLDYSTGLDPNPFVGPVYRDVFGAVGVYTVDFSVIDSGGLTSSGSFDVRVYDQPPL